MKVKPVFGYAPIDKKGDIWESFIRSASSTSRLDLGSVLFGGTKNFRFRKVKITLVPTKRKSK